MQNNRALQIIFCVSGLCGLCVDLTLLPGRKLRAIDTLQAGTLLTWLKGFVESGNSLAEKKVIVATCEIACVIYCLLGLMQHFLFLFINIVMKDCS